MISPIRLILRPWQPEDAPALAAHATNPAIARYLYQPFPEVYTEDDARIDIEQATTEKPTRNFAVVADDLLVGSVSISPGEGVYERSARLRVWLADEHQGRGLGTKVISQATYYAFSTWPVVRVEVRCFGGNVATQKALLNAGFRQEARMEKAVFRDGRLHDEYIFAILNPDYETPELGEDARSRAAHSPHPEARM
jgi:RimJ/RimL family protein N-acetyltransferase